MCVILFRISVIDSDLDCFNQIEKVIMLKWDPLESSLSNVDDKMLNDFYENIFIARAVKYPMSVFVSCL